MSCATVLIYLDSPEDGYTVILYHKSEPSIIPHILCIESRFSELNPNRLADLGAVLGKLVSKNAATGLEGT